MARQKLLLSDLSGGELSPKLRARADIAAHTKGSERMVNFIPMIQGGARFRPGSRFVGKTFSVRPDLDTVNGAGGLARVVPFAFNDAQSYILEFAHKHIRVYRGGELQVSTTNISITNVTNAVTYGEITAVGHGLHGGEEIFMNSVGGITNYNRSDGNGPFLVVRTPDVDTIHILPKASGTYTSGGVINRVVNARYTSSATITNATVGGGGSTLQITLSSAYQQLRVGDWVSIKSLNGITGDANSVFQMTAVTSDLVFTVTDPAAGFGGTFSSSPNSSVRLLPPYQTADMTNWLTGFGTEQDNPEIYDFQYVQSADTMYLVHPDYHIRKIVRTAADTFIMSTPEFTNGGPFDQEDTYPSVIAFHESRLIVGGSNDEPLKLYGSKSGLFEDFTTGSNDDDSYSFTLAGRRTTKINWVETADKFMLVGCQGQDFRVFGNTQDSAITPTNITSKAVDYRGSALVQPVTKDKTVFFVPFGGNQLATLIFDVNVDGYKPQILTKLADHILRNVVREMSTQNGEPGVIWLVSETGQLIGMTFDRDEGVVGFHEHKTRTGELYESVASIPQTTDYDETYFVMKRTINGIVTRYIERFHVPQEFPRRVDYDTGVKATDDANFLRDMWEAQKDAIHLDCVLTYDGSVETDGVSITPGATTGEGVTFTAGSALFESGDVGREIWNRTGNGRATITVFNSSTSVDCDITVDFPSTSAISGGDWYLTASTFDGLEHLEGESVQVLGDGFVLDDETVSSGEITLDRQYSVVHIGFEYKGLIKTMPLEYGGTLGTSQGEPKNVNQASVSLLNALGLEIGIDMYNLTKQPFKTKFGLLSRPEPLFTGSKPVSWPDNWERDKQIILVQDQPLPCTILGIFLDGTSSDG